MAKRQNTQVNKGIIAKTLDWAYSKAVSGFTGVDSAYDLGNSYLAQQGSLEAQVDSLIKWQVAKAATSGFVTGLGGVMIMPLTVPANIASVIYVQIRMIAAIAYMGGHDIREDRVKSLIYICMVGNGAKELLKDVSVKAGERLAAKIAEKVSTSIASKTGEKSVTSLGKAVPVLGGVVGGSYDAITTRVVGKVAKKIFIDKQASEKD
ncbi:MULTISPECIES: EcsC family protein [Dysgonomonas]|uniref:EcsC family protein n=1 Tax=Dysgonomonas TaxID=156973 RepID=UPI000925E91A|nr:MULTISPECIES: EcsC family protein [Dysgonomonas]MBN9300474.1 EcsC family protein [Dysgonomonas mossii]OJX57423.1 MAG: EcsC family protein [Dysgonomonas sp. 37-18]